MRPLARPIVASLPAALGVFALAMVLTAGFTRFAFQVTQAQAEANFAALARRTQTAVEQRIQVYINLLYAGRAFLSASDGITRQEWASFVSAMDLAERYPGIQGFGYAVSVSPEARDAHVARVRRDGLPDYRLWPEGDRPELTAIMYLEPMDERNRAALGYDMFSNPTRREAMSRARDTGEPALSGKVQLVQEITENKQAGFLIYLPVYRNAASPFTVEARRAALLGYVYAPFRADDLFRGIFGSTPHPEIDFEIYDGPPSAETLLHDHNPAVPGLSEGHGMHMQTPLHLAGRQWTIVYTTTPRFSREPENRLVLAIFLGGMLVSMLLAAITWSLASSRQRALRLATEMTDELRKADKAKDEFLSVISHELRTPLNFIMGFGSILEDEVVGPLNPKQKEYLAKLLKGADRMLLLVNDLLDFAKIQAGMLDLHRSPTPLKPLVDEVFSTMSPLAQQKGLRLESEISDPGLLDVDGGRIVQVLTNLVGNAIKFTPTGGRISLASRLEGNCVRLEVRDNGIGIAPGDIPKLFTRFQQLDMSSMRQVGGTGLGLSISKAIVEGHGGSIGVKSEKGQGSTFWVTLPRARS